MREETAKANVASLSVTAPEAVAPMDVEDDPSPRLGG